MRCVLLLLFLTPFTLFAQSEKLAKYGVDTSFVVPNGLEVGDIAPQFSVSDVSGLRVDLAELREKGTVVILFYRGQWCPVCSRYLNNLNDSINLINEQGATVIAIGPETIDNALKTQKNTKSKFSFIADTSLQIHRSYDVLFHVTRKYQMKIKNFLRTDIAHNNGSDKAMLPVPATFVISREGKIVFKQFNYNYKDRASVKSILQHL